MAASQVKHVAQLLAPVELQKQQEISALPWREARHCQQGNQSATSCYFGNICSPAEILLAHLASNLEKNPYSWMFHFDVTSPGIFLRLCLSIYSFITLYKQRVWATNSESRSKLSGKFK